MVADERKIQIGKFGSARRSRKILPFPTLGSDLFFRNKKQDPREAAWWVTKILF